MVNLTLEELVEKHWLSVRSTNVLLSSELLYLINILDYYIANCTFSNIKNCGSTSDRELIELCNMYLEQYQAQLNGNSLAMQDVLDVYDDLEPLKKSVFNRFFNSLHSRLSTRASNSLESCCTGEWSISHVIGFLFSDKTYLEEIKNVGKKTKGELTAFKSQIKTFLLDLVNLSKSKLTTSYFKLIIDQIVGKGEFKLNEEPDIFFINDRLRLFKVLDELISGGYICNPTKTKILKTVYSQDGMVSLKRIADELLLTRERVRQLNKEIEDDFNLSFGFVTNFSIADCVEYGISTGQDIIVIDNGFTNRVNKIDRVNFNSLFFANTICLLLGNAYSLFDPNDAELKRTSISDRSNQHDFYLISKPIFELFDFEGFLFDINSKLAERITDDYSLYFEGYLLDFFSAKPDIHQVKTTSELCRIILFNETDMVVDQFGYLLFERNVRKQMSDYAFEALEAIGEVAHISEILEVATKRYPEVEFNETSFQSLFSREKELFICIGRSSTFGLKQWEVTTDNVRGGTIKTIVEEYLLGFDNPMHISEILLYVNQFRATNEKNVMTNIEIDQTGKFVVFPGEFIGLADKIYYNTQIYKRLFGTHFRTAEIKKVKSQNLDDIVNHYTQCYNYLDVQVRSTLMKRVANGDFKLTADNKLIV